MPRIVDIASADHPLAEPFRQVRERDLTGRQGQFIIEGETVLRVAIAHRPALVQSLLIAENQFEKLGPLLAVLPGEIPVARAPREIVEEIAGFPLHRGILGLGLKPPDKTPAALLGNLPGPRLIIACIGISNHDNIGGIFRNAAAFGADAALIDDTCCDPFYRKALRVSAGGVLRLPFARGNADEIISALQAEGFALAALSPSGRTKLQDWQVPPRAALLFGTEGPGLPQEILMRCENLRIPMSGGFDSINVAASAAVALNHARNNAWSL